MLKKFYSTTRKILLILLISTTILVFARVVVLRTELHIFYSDTPPYTNDFLITLLGGKIFYHEISRINPDMLLLSVLEYRKFSDEFREGVIYTGSNNFEKFSNERVYEILLKYFTGGVK
ncbi:MAG: hypothetical protein PHW96_04930 [Candidatus Nanoarchaeia archaeon]|nr:hypothetical protein [Candidatus Nanoarchaeia archaeon]